MTIEDLVRKYDLNEGHRHAIEILVSLGHTLEELDEGLAEATSGRLEPTGEFRGVGAAAGKDEQP